jgi:soluble lytic murein transglycosylase-like protein
LIPKLGKPKAIQLCKNLHHWVNEEGNLWKIGDAQKLPWYSGLAKKTVEVQQAAYPPAYLDQAIASASLENDQISPWWILGHMLQESRYRTGVVSGAGAVGLMQILPRTGRLIWEIVKWPKEEFYRARLYESGLSVRYGTWYLMRLYEDLKHPIWAMAAYNGGPLRMVEHINKHLHLPFDEVLEEFGSHESRNYARKITDHFVRYLHMYASEDDRLFWTRKLLPPKQVAKPDENVKF